MSPRIQFIYVKSLTLIVLPLIKDAQNQHGLRHGDYQRYRYMCVYDVHLCVCVCVCVCERERERERVKLLEGIIGLISLSLSLSLSPGCTAAGDFVVFASHFTSLKATETGTRGKLSLWIKSLTSGRLCV